MDIFVRDFECYFYIPNVQFIGFFNICVSEHLNQQLGNYRLFNNKKLENYLDEDEL